MKKVLIAVEGSPSCDRAVQAIIRKYGAEAKAGKVEIHLLNVQHPVSGDVNTFVDHDEIKKYHHDEGLKALASARTALDLAKVPYFIHVSVGEPWEIIVRFAEEKKCEEIVLGTHKHSAIMTFLVGAVDTDVKRHTTIPVTVVE